MPAKTEKQRRFAGMSRTAKGRRKLRASGKRPMSPRVARKFSRKSK